MLASIPDVLTCNELTLLLHLATFQLPVFFNDICITFIDTERNPAVILELLVSLLLKKHVCTVEHIQPKVEDKPATTYILYALTDFGKNEALAYNLLTDDPIPSIKH